MSSCLLGPRGRVRSKKQICMNSRAASERIVIRMYEVCSMLSLGHAMHVWESCEDPLAPTANTTCVIPLAVTTTLAHYIASRALLIIPSPWLLDTHPHTLCIKARLQVLHIVGIGHDILCARAARAPSPNEYTTCLGFACRVHLQLNII
jgi:hypothetical protein